MKNIRVLAAIGLALVIALTMAACTTVKPGKLAESDQIEINYVYPEYPDHEKIYG